MLRFYNTLTAKKEIFQAIDSNNVRMYVCGPTLYNKIHIGNARSIVIYDVLFRLLREIYGENAVKYCRNITDVDDKIINEAKLKNISEHKLTTEMIEYFHRDCEYLHCLKPTFEPKVTENIPEIIQIIQKLIDNNNAYIQDGHVLFDVSSYKDYGKLSNRKIDELISGARIEIADYKKNPLDFVLWKPSSPNDDISSIFSSPWGEGRPGWHIECSAMSFKFLGENFDIHGGGADLQFPHHENEIAQSCSAHRGSSYASYWIHNGFLTINCDKMSKSLNTFITVDDICKRNINGSILKFALLSTNYNRPLDFTEKLLEDSQKTIDKFSHYLVHRNYNKNSNDIDIEDKKEALNILSNDLNFSEFFAYMQKLCEDKEYDKLGYCIHNLLGLEKIKLNFTEPNFSEEITKLAEERNIAKQNKNFKLADELRNKIIEKGYAIKDLINEGFLIIKNSNLT